MAQIIAVLETRVIASYRLLRERSAGRRGYFTARSKTADKHACFNCVSMIA